MARIFVAPLIFCGILRLAFSVFEDPVCSKYHFEEKVLEKLVRLELRVETELAETKNKIKSFESMISSESKARFDNVADDLKNIEERFETSLADLNSKILGSVNETIGTLRQKDRKLRSNVGTLARELAQMRYHFRQNIRDRVLFVASSEGENFISNNKPVRFDTVLVNMAEGYSRRKGIFTAPLDGAYLFSVQICLERQLNYQILVNDVAYSTTFKHRSTDGDNSCSSVVTTAFLSTNDTAWVKPINHDEAIVSISSVHPAWSMFTGILIG